MPSIFNSLMQSIKPVHDEVFSETVEIGGVGGGETLPIEAVLGKARTVTRTDEDGRRYRLTVRTCRIVTLDDITHTSYITDSDGVVWSIDEIHKRGASGLYLTLRRSEVRDVTRPGYRRRP